MIFYVATSLHVFFDIVLLPLITPSYLETPYRTPSTWLVTRDVLPYTVTVVCIIPWTRKFSFSGVTWQVIWSSTAFRQMILALRSFASRPTEIYLTSASSIMDGLPVHFAKGLVTLPCSRKLCTTFCDFWHKSDWTVSSYPFCKVPSSNKYITADCWMVKVSWISLLGVII